MNTPRKPCLRRRGAGKGDEGRFVLSFSRLSSFIHRSWAALRLCPCSPGTRRAPSTTGLNGYRTEDEKVGSGVNPAGLQRAAPVGREEKTPERWDGGSQGDLTDSVSVSEPQTCLLNLDQISFQLLSPLLPVWPPPPHMAPGLETLHVLLLIDT